MPADLIARCAAFGWFLRPDGDEWELLNNGPIAAFRSTATLSEWLSRQERTRPQREIVRLDDYRQLSIFDEAA